MKVKEITVMVPTAAPVVREGDKKWSKVFDSVADKIVSKYSSRFYVCHQIDDEPIDHSQKVRMKEYILKLLDYETLIGWALYKAPIGQVPEVEMHNLYRSLWCKRLAKQFRKAGL